MEITDAAGKRKKYETDGSGQLAKGIEPDPVGDAELETTYAYSIRGQITTATMTRAGTTQVRLVRYEGRVSRSVCAQ